MLVGNFGTQTMQKHTHIQSLAPTVLRCAHLYVASVALPLTGSGGDMLEMATWPGMSSSLSGTGDCR